MSNRQCRVCQITILNLFEQDRQIADNRVFEPDSKRLGFIVHRYDQRLPVRCSRCRQGTVKAFIASKDLIVVKLEITNQLTVTVTHGVSWRTVIAAHQCAIFQRQGRQ